MPHNSDPSTNGASNVVPIRFKLLRPYLEPQKHLLRDKWLWYPVYTLKDGRKTASGQARVWLFPGRPPATTFDGRYIWDWPLAGHKNVHTPIPYWCF